MIKKILFIALSIPVVTLANPADELDGLIEEYWQNQLQESPFSATHNGMTDYNRQVPTVAPKDHARRTQQAAEFLRQLRNIDLNELQDGERINGELLEFILRHDVALAEFEGWRIPILADSGFHLSMNYVVGATPFRNKLDYQDYLARLSALPGYVDQNVANMRRGLRDRFTQPKQILNGILPSFEALVVDDP
ncbi:MAG: DUF885 family protein, partial [Pseudomonadota bacterium]